MVTAVSLVLAPVCLFLSTIALPPLKSSDSADGCALPLQLSGIAFLVGIALLAMGLVRGHLAPVAVAVGLVAGTFLNLLGFASSSVLVLDVSGAVLVVAMGWLGLRVAS